jgi:hypothetical protein
MPYGFAGRRHERFCEPRAVVPSYSNGLLELADDLVFGGEQHCEHFITVRGGAEVREQPSL